MIPTGAMIAAAEAKSVVKHFRDAGAISPGDAIAWTPEGKLQDYEYKQLTAKGALVEMRQGRYYLNEEKLAAGGGVQATLLVAAGAAMLALGGAWMLLRG